MAERQHRVAGELGLAFLVLLWRLCASPPSRRDPGNHRLRGQGLRRPRRADIRTSIYVVKLGPPTRASNPGPATARTRGSSTSHFPTGFIGNPHDVPACSLTEFSSARMLPGLAGRGHRGSRHAPAGPATTWCPMPTRRAWSASTSREPKRLSITVLQRPHRVSDYGLDATSSAIYHLLPISNIEVHIWGVPADPSHDNNRFPQGKTEGVNASRIRGAVRLGGLHLPARALPSRARLPAAYRWSPVTRSSTTPGPSTTAFDALAGDDGLRPARVSIRASLRSRDHGGGRQRLRPRRRAQGAADAEPDGSRRRPRSATYDDASRRLFHQPQRGQRQARLRRHGTVVRNAKKQRIAPSSPRSAPRRIDSSALPGPIQGSIYIGQPLPGQTYRAFITADGFATHVKLKAAVQLDPDSGRIVTSFTDLPQAPIQEVDLHFFGSERGIFATPRKCGSYPVVTKFVPWDAALEDQVSTSEISIDSGPGGSPCPPSPGRSTRSSTPGAPTTRRGLSRRSRSR